MSVYDASVSCVDMKEAHEGESTVIIPSKEAVIDPLTRIQKINLQEHGSDRHLAAAWY